MILKILLRIGNFYVDFTVVHIILYYNDRRMKQKLYFDVAIHVYLLTAINGFYYNKFLWLSL